MVISMRQFVLVVFACAIGGQACEAANTARGEKPTAQAIATAMPVFVQDVHPDAIDAVKVVDAFSKAIKAAKIPEAGALLDPSVLILESGGSERSRDDYLREHALADAAFLQSAQQQLRFRRARASGELAWVATESLITSGKEGAKRTVRSTETMVLQEHEGRWTIVHIHWSSGSQ